MDKKVEYYQGKDVGIRFEVFKDGEEIRPGSAVVSIYRDKRQFVKQDVASVSGNEVKYILKGEDVQFAGKYIFVFDVAVRGMGNYTHVVDVEVKKLPVKLRNVKEV